jgi:PQQ-dependent catabolism-associated CXXCW motif protein
MNRTLQWCVAASMATGSATALAQDSFGGGARPSGPATAAPPARQPAPVGPAAATPGAGADLDKLMAKERQELGVAPVSGLHNGAMHGPTPAKIPGGQLITTKGLIALVQGRQVPYLLFDVLGGPEMLPGAIPAAGAAQPGSFDDEVQRGFGAYLEQATRGDKRMAMVFYCQSTHCWMSYNAALRAIRLGYGNVLWYRGGIEAWKEAGLSLAQPPRPGQQRP